MAEATHDITFIVNHDLRLIEVLRIPLIPVCDTCDLDVMGVQMEHDDMSFEEAHYCTQSNWPDPQ